MMNYDPSTPLFVPPDGRFAIKNTDEALRVALTDPKKPLLIYIHGRAKDVGEPRKSLDEGIYSDLNNYGVNTLGFTWDADDGGYDESRPAASAPDFLLFLEKVQAYYTRPENSGLPSPSLITHSMGALVISELAKDEALGPGKPTFLQNLILSAAAVKTKRHDRWLRNISIAERIFVTVNPNDVALGFAGLLFKPNMLGRDLSTPAVLGGRVVYVDLSRLNVNHRYFVKSGQNGHASLREFYTAGLKGNRPNLDAISAPGNSNGVPVAVLLAG